MKSKFFVVCVGALLLLTAGCDKLRSRDALNKGVQAYKSAKYPDAVEYFKKSVALDPTNENGRLYLGTSYMQQYIPGADSPDNVQMARAAKDEFMKVLEKNPQEKLALASLANLSYQQANGVSDLDQKLKRLDDARDWYLKLIAADPKNKEAYYTLGVIDWAKVYPARTTARARLGMRPEDPGPIKDKKVKDDLKARNGSIVEDGIQNLQKSLEIDPNYDDAMAYMNLMYRERADLEDTADAYKKDVETADGWVQKSLDTKKAKAAKQPAGGISQEAK
jgi:tetratricopeptide (TPR) repeat protein